MQNTHHLATTSLRSNETIASLWYEWSLTRKRSKQNLVDTNEVDPIIQEHMNILKYVSPYTGDSQSPEEMQAHECAIKAKTQQAIKENPIIPPDTRHIHPQTAQYDTSPHLRAGKSRRLNHYKDTSMSSNGNSNSNDHFWDQLYTFNPRMKPYKLTH